MAAEKLGSCFYFGQGVAVNYARAMAAYKVGAEGGHATCQHQLGTFYYRGLVHGGVNFPKALKWFVGVSPVTTAVHELKTSLPSHHPPPLSPPRLSLRYKKAAAQNHANSVGELGTMACFGQAQTPSYRLARRYYRRAVALDATTTHAASLAAADGFIEMVRCADAPT